MLNFLGSLNFFKFKIVKYGRLSLKICKLYFPNFYFKIFSTWDVINF